MLKVLMIKVTQNKMFKNTLLNSNSQELFEATAGNFWGIGMSLNTDTNTKSNYFHGKIKSIKESETAISQEK